MELSTEVLAAWYTARDTFLGVNEVPQNMAKGLTLAKELVDKVPEAKWLCCEAFPDGCPTSILIARERLADLYARTKNPTALCYAYFVAQFHNRWQDSESRAVLMQHSLYEALYYSRISGAVKRVYKKGNREPVLLVALAAANNDNFSKIKYRDLLKRAAELNNINGCFHWGQTFDSDDPQRYYWTGKAARRGHRIGDFLIFARGYVSRYAQNFVQGMGHESSRCIVEMGRAMTDCMSLERISSTFHAEGQYAATVQKVLQFCRIWRIVAHNAVNAWTGVARRLRVVHDIRKMISKLVWDTWMDSVEHRYDGTMSYLAEPVNPQWHEYEPPSRKYTRSMG
jgi:hypothetical protein